VVEAINYPAPNIKRDKVFPLLLKFKNAPTKKIIIYNFDERTGIPVARIFYDKGYDNIYLMSGGIEEFVQLHHHLVEGEKVPVLKHNPNKKHKKQKKNTILMRSDYMTPMSHAQRSQVKFKPKKKKKDDYYFDTKPIDNNRINPPPF